MANQANGTQEIWVPAWRFTLARDRGTHTTDTDVSYGDLDVSDSVVIRGVAGRTSVAWKPGIVDAVFELLGDSSHDGIVDAVDYTVWRNALGSTTDLRADGDDDGVVDADDYTIWQQNFGHTLQLFDVGV